MDMKKVNTEDRRVQTVWTKAKDNPKVLEGFELLSELLGIMCRGMSAKDADVAARAFHKLLIGILIHGYDEKLTVYEIADFMEVVVESAESEMDPDHSRRAKNVVDSIRIMPVPPQLSH